MRSGAAISGGYFWRIFRIRIKIGMNAPWGLLFGKKTHLANQNVKTAIFQDGRHFEYKNMRFFE